LRVALSRHGRRRRPGPPGTAPTGSPGACYKRQARQTTRRTRGRGRARPLGDRRGHLGRPGRRRPRRAACPADLLRCRAARGHLAAAGESAAKPGRRSSAGWPAVHRAPGRRRRSWPASSGPARWQPTAGALLERLETTADPAEKFSTARPRSATCCATRSYRPTCYPPNWPAPNYADGYAHTKRTGPLLLVTQLHNSRIWDA